ncbi:MAG: hypothetical protein ACI38U_09275 [Corynebacterium sp.]|uniref:hypothetical protein n=1 Tax=Corynebacterium sp. TaxID=1720 RepID=UPI003F079A08
MEHRAWIDGLIDGDSYRAAAEKVGTNGSTITRQLAKEHLSPEMVIALCRAYGCKPVDGLVETGYLQPWEIEGVGIDTAIDQATNKQLLDGIMRRSDPEAQYLFGRTEDVINPEMDERNNVVDIHTGSPHSFANEQGEPDGTTPSVRDDWQDNETHPREHPDFPGMEWDWDRNMPKGAVADSSPEEGETDEDDWTP